MKLNGSPQLRLHNEKSDVCWPCLYYLQNTSCQPSDTYAMRCPATSTTISGVWWHWRNVGEQPVVASQQLVSISVHQNQQWCRGLAKPIQSAGMQGEARHLSACCTAVPQRRFHVPPVCTGLWTPFLSAPAEALCPCPGLSGHVLDGIMAYSAGEMTTTTLLKCLYVYELVRRV